MKIILMNPPKIKTIKSVTRSVTVYKLGNANYRIISLSNGKTIKTVIRDIKGKYLKNYK